MQRSMPADITQPTTAPDAGAGRRRVVVERLRPEIDGGRFAVKRTVGESVVVTADLFADGHDVLAGVLKYRRIPPVIAGVPAAAAGAPPPDSAP